jgi:hypothetical protein
LSRLTREQLEQMREDGLSRDVREAFAAAEHASDAWERERGRARSQLGIDEILGWIDELRAVFGEPEVDRRPWIGNDFRL